MLELALCSQLMVLGSQTQATRLGVKHGTLWGVLSSPKVNLVALSLESELDHVSLSFPWTWNIFISSNRNLLPVYGDIFERVCVPQELTQAGWPTSSVILHPLSPRVVQLLVVTCAWEKFYFGSFFHRFQQKLASLLWASGTTDYVGGKGIWCKRPLTHGN